MKSALISVSDKTGIIDFAKGLATHGYRLISTGGTHRALQEAGLDVVGISEVTGFPEILDGRVKTLHPNVHAGILAMDKPEHMDVLEAHHIQTIDMVVVNLYPFAETIAKPDVTLAQAIENIDIGGPTMIRSAAKNHARVAVVVDPTLYDSVLQALEVDKGTLSLDFKRQMALKAFEHTAQYDATISRYLQTAFEGPLLSAEFTLGGKKVQDMSYGENPHQKAAFYASNAYAGSVAGATQKNGKALSYNNIVDVDAAWQLVTEYDVPACAIIKHTNPCGLATAETIADAYRRAYDADSLSAFGGIIALNREVDAATAEQIVQTFMEAVIAPGFTDEALTVLKTKEKLRVLDAQVARQSTEPWVERISGGFLVQERDNKHLTRSDLQCVTEKMPSDQEIDDMLFAWRAVKHVKSNAIVVAKNGVTLGVGAGQMNRVGSCDISFKKAGEEARGAVLASDAFFPFRDSIDAAAAVGITAIIQPGGSIHDEDVVAACNELGIAMMYTGVRHFKH